MLRDGHDDEAAAVFRESADLYPDSRHIHAGLAWTILAAYSDSASENDLRSCVAEFLLADEIGMRYGAVHYSQPVALGLGALRDTEGLDSYFEAALALPGDDYPALLDYARGLAAANDPRAEARFSEALGLEPHGLADAAAYYSEWLLDRDRAADVLSLATNNSSVLYLEFLRGVALERLGRGAEADVHYDRFRDFSASFPAPPRYRITGSRHQAGICFLGDMLPRYSMAEALAKLSRVISGEARGESVGQQRAVGWTVRTRVFLAYSVSTGCGGYPSGAWGAISSGQSLADRYYAICNASGQFAEYTATPSTDSRAYEVYYGSVPDPIRQACISGTVTGTWCDGTCSSSAFYEAFSEGPAWFSANCPTYHETGCGQYRTWKPCGGSGNCFYRLPE